MSKKVKKIVIPLLVSIVLGFVWFYITIPAINLKSSSFYSFLLFLIVVFIVTRLIITFSIRGIRDKVTDFKDQHQSGGEKVFADMKPSSKKKLKIATWIVVILLVGAGIIWLTSSEITNAKKYQQQLTVNTRDFQEDVAEIPISQIPIVDKDTAVRLGDRKLGEVVELTSQFEVSPLYSQINMNNAPTRVSPLVYADPIKWLTNQSEGIPYYIQIDMATQDTQLVELESPMKYSPCEYFNRRLERHVRFAYPTLMFEDPTFEVDDDGNPYWVVPYYDYEIGIIGGKDIVGIVLVDAVSGEMTRYAVEDVPQWIDQVYPDDLLNIQANNWGKYTNGFINSIIGQKNVIKTTDGYNHLALDDDLWMYTGLSSVTADQSNIGFLLVNKRTKETRYYQINGADESSAMSSAEGKVQEKEYVATFPILINVAEQPTYFVSLKDAAGLVKEFAFVSVENYQTVGVGDTLSSAQDSYIKQLKSSGQATESETTSVSGVISQITSAVKEGNTYYYFTLDGKPEEVYVASIELSDGLPMLKQGDTVALDFQEDAFHYRQVTTIEIGFSSKTE